MGTGKGIRQGSKETLSGHEMVSLEDKKGWALTLVTPHHAEGGAVEEIKG